MVRSAAAAETQSDPTQRRVGVVEREVILFEAVAETAPRIEPHNLREGGVVGAHRAMIALQDDDFGVAGVDGQSVEDRAPKLRWVNATRR